MASKLFGALNETKGYAIQVTGRQTTGVLRLMQETDRDIKKNMASGAGIGLQPFINMNVKHAYLQRALKKCTFAD